MKLIYLVTAFFLSTVLISCSNQSEEKSRIQKEDSIRKADSVKQAIEKQRIIDSVNLVMHEQQIIADSIQNQVEN